MLLEVLAVDDDSSSKVRKSSGKYLQMVFELVLS